MKTNKTVSVTEDKLPTIIESTDGNLTKDFPVKLIISNINNHVLLSEANIDSKLIKPWNIVSAKNHTLLIILTDGLTIDTNKLNTSLTKLLTLCNKFKIAKLVFERNNFFGTETKYNTIKDSIQNLFTKTNIHFLFLTNKIITLTDQNEIKQILHDFHNTPMAGHQGVHRMAHKIGAKYKWVGLRKDVQDYVRNCHTCQIR